MASPKPWEWKLLTSPRPWKWVSQRPSGHGIDDQGAIVDANGDEVMWFGDGETYYPTPGEAPSTGDLELLLRAVNAIPNEKE